MPTLDITQNYATGQVLTKTHLDDAFSSVETFINTTKLDTNNIQTSGVATANLADSCVTTAKIADSNVTTAKIADSNVTTAKIADSNVTTAKIANEAITYAKLADRTVTTDGTNPGAGGIAGSVNSGNFTSSSTSFTTVTDGSSNVSCALTTTGKPVRVWTVPGNGSNTGKLFANNGTIANYSEWKIVRDSTDIALGAINAATILSPYPIAFDNPPSGTYTYTLQVKAYSGATVSVSYLSMFAEEI